MPLRDLEEVPNLERKKEPSTPNRKNNKVKDDPQILPDQNGNTSERRPSLTGTNGSTRAPSSLSREPTHHHHTEVTVLSTRPENNQRPTRSSSSSSHAHPTTTPPTTRGRRSRKQHPPSSSTTPSTPVDLDEDADFPDSDDENNPTKIVSSSASSHKHTTTTATTTKLTSKQLQQFNLKTTAASQSSPHKNNLYNFNDHHDDQDDQNDRPGTSTPRSSKSSKSDDDSEFNLSTDAEDTEYNNMRRMTRPKSGPYAAPTSALDVSHASTVSALQYDTSALDITSPPSDEEDPTVFAALKHIPVGSPRTSSTSKQQAIVPAPPGKPESSQNNQLAVVPQPSSQNYDDMRAWTTTTTATDGFVASPHKPVDPPASTGFGNFANFDDTFEDLNTWQDFQTDSHNDKPTSAAAAPVVSTQPQQPPPKKKQQVVSIVPGHDDAMNTHTNGVVPESPLADLLAQAKEKRSSRSARHKASGSSINSAPAITPAYLRQQHNLQRSSQPHETTTAPKDSSSVTSVSDIIQNLEATQVARARSTASASVGGNSSVRSAKERLRAKRRKERERQQQQQQQHHSSDDSDDDDHFLHHGVTAGKTSDQESLSGRSKNSTGQRSHKSHRSHRSSHRTRRPRSSHGHHGHTKSSSDSVGSKGSRRSNGSRYSHRSTRSYLSHMSEQSKSVANDLLRLEMQLAMVGSTENNGGGAGGAGGRGMESGSMSGNSISGTSRTSRASRSSRASHRTHRSTASGMTHGVKKTKVNVFAPPGKLGIILANKADAKGTVVSGVRTSSVLVEKISPGDRIIAIDGEDVSRMTVSEITTIMARKSEFERILTVLTTIKPITPSKAGSIEFENKFRTTTAT